MLVLPLQHRMQDMVCKGAAFPLGDVLLHVAGERGGCSWEQTCAGDQVTGI
jgi:hypothetical protein